MAEVITDHLDLWTSALLTKSAAGRGSNGKPEAYGIKKLRELILELAVRGKLVPQDLGDNHTSELLKKIFAEKAEPIRAGQARKERSPAESNDEEMRFALPKSWAWIPLGGLAEVLDSQRKPITKTSRNAGPYPYYGASGVVDYVAEYIFDEPLVLVGEDGAKWGRGDHTAFSISGETWVNNHAHVLRPNRSCILDSYLVYFLTITDLNKYITGMTVPKLNQARLVSIPVALPPLAEQHRIVAKVDELMELCDKLEQQQTDSIAAHQTLVETLLGTLSRVTSQQEFSAAWALIASHFDTLFTSEASIDQLKQTILQLAVMGKLLPQELTWDDKYLGELGDWAVGSGFPKSEQGKEGLEILFAKVSDMNLPENAKFIVTTNHTISEKTGKKLGVNVHAPGTVIFPKIGGAIATNKRRILTRPTAIDNNCLGITPKTKVSTDWLYLVLSSIDFVEYQAGTSVPALSQGTLAKIPVWLPPLAEQHRIVAKVDELMALCDALKARLAEAQTIQLHLADAIVEQAVS